MKRFAWMLLAWLLVRSGCHVLEQNPIWWQWFLGTLLVAIGLECYAKLTTDQSR